MPKRMIHFTHTRQQCRTPQRRTKNNNMAYCLATYFDRRRYQPASAAYQSAKIAFSQAFFELTTRDRPYLQHTRTRYARIGRALAVAVASDDSEQVTQSLAELPRRAQLRALATLGERFDLGECADCNSVAPIQDLSAHELCAECEGEYWTCERCGCRTTDAPATVEECNCCESCAEDAHHGEEEEEPEEDSGQLPNYGTFGRRCRKFGTTLPHLADCGIELEFLAEDVLECAAHLVRDSDLVCGVEQDGSLDAGGGEIVTHYGPLPDVVTKVGPICRTLQKFGARSHDTDCCGLHVSLSCGNCSTYEIAKYVVFWNLPQNAGFLTVFARRWGEFYAAPKPESKGKRPAGPDDENTLRDVLADGDRRELVNLQERHRGRLEVRAFRGSTRTETVRACVELSVLSLTYCRTEAPTLLWPDFLRWLKSSEFAPHGKNLLSYWKNRKTLTQNEV